MLPIYKKEQVDLLEAVAARRLLHPFWSVRFPQKRKDHK